MKKRIPIRLLTLVIVITAAVFVLAAARTATPSAETTEECTPSEEESCEKQVQSEFVLQTLTRNLMGR